jgi:hypothetical protein
MTEADIKRAVSFIYAFVSNKENLTSCLQQKFCHRSASSRCRSESGSLRPRSVLFVLGKADTGADREARNTADRELAVSVTRPGHSLSQFFLGTNKKKQASQLIKKI